MTKSGTAETRVMFRAAQRVRKEKLDRITRFNGDLRKSPLKRSALAGAAYEDCVIVEQVIEEMRAALNRYRKAKR